MNARDRYAATEAVRDYKWTRAVERLLAAIVAEVGEALAEEEGEIPAADVLAEKESVREALRELWEAAQ